VLRFASKQSLMTPFFPFEVGSVVKHANHTHPIVLSQLPRSGKIVALFPDLFGLSGVNRRKAV
jgi:hypothetical protein